MISYLFPHLVNLYFVAEVMGRKRRRSSSSSSDGTPFWFLLAGPAVGIAIYSALYLYYRNTDKSHNFERETLIEAQPVTGQDTKVDEVTRTKREYIDGDNSEDHRERVQRVQ